MIKRIAAVAVAMIASAGTADGQRVDVRTAVVLEQYRFDSGLAFARAAELSIPVTATIGLGERSDLTISTGYARVVVDSAGADGVRRELAGMLDTEVRLGVSLIRDRLVVLLTGAAPTGQATLAIEDGAALQALATDVIGFAAPSLGSGGSLGAGFVAALPAGRMAIGLAGRFTQPLAYEPVAGVPDEVRLRPGGEFRLRAGMEGPLGRTTYLRLAGIFARRGRDEINDVKGAGLGNRYAAYVSLDQAVGSASVTLYGFDLFRASPQLEQTVVGAAVLPRGNMIGGGAQVTFRLARRTQLTPRAEYRAAWEASRFIREDRIDDGPLERVGTSLRFGADLRHPVSSRFGLVLQAEGAAGNLVAPSMGETRAIGFQGFRLGLHVEVKR